MLSMKPEGLVLTCSLLAIAVCQLDDCTLRSYTVSPSNGTDSSGCLGLRSTGGACKSLQFLVKNNVTRCANITILENITLTKSLEFRHDNTSNLLISGPLSGDAVCVKCENYSGLLFISAHKIQIANINFVGCSMLIHNIIDISSINPSMSVSIVFVNGSEIEVLNCKFTEYEGSSLLLLDVVGGSIENSNFSLYMSSIQPTVKSVGTGGIVIRRQVTSTNEVVRYDIRNCLFENTWNIVTECPKDTYFIPKMTVHGCGGGIDIGLFVANSTTNVTIADSSFFSNTALYGGALCTAFSGINSNSILNVIGSVFQSNIACSQGGAVSFRAVSALQHDPIKSTGKITIDSCTFKNNTAYLGGAVSVHRCQYCANITFLARFSNWTWNNANISGFGLHIGGNSTTNDQNNSYKVLGYHLQASLDNCMFVNNTNNAHFRNINAVGALQVTACDLTFTGNTEFVSNRGTALVLKALSKVTFFGNVRFEENFGINGGAIELVKASQIRINSTCTLLFARNRAIVKGGAIYSKVNSEIHIYPPVPCPFDFQDTGLASITFEHNIASNSNQSVYIGNHHECDLNITTKWSYIPDTDGQVETFADVYSLRSEPDMTNGMMLGEVFFLFPTVADAFNSTSSSTFGYLALLSFQYFESLNHTLVGPTSLTFDRFAQNTEFYIKGPEIKENSNIEFVIEYIYDQVTTFRSKSAELKVKMVPCKLGYNYSIEDGICVCVDDVRKNIICPNASRAMACLRKGYWYDRERMEALPCPLTNCNYTNGNCPNYSCPTSPGFCVVENSNDPCWKGRGQYLCSKCEDNYAFNFGAFKCISKNTCNITNRFLTVLAIFFYWVFLIVLILVILSLQLSVGSGFMYGLVYYFSVISLLSDKSIYDDFLQKIIAICRSLTQLDPHFITRLMNICFIQEIDDPLYHLVLCYITPVFVIFVILAIIKLAQWRYCCLPRCISLADNSPIHAFCMLILFAYSSLSHTNIQILRPLRIDDEWYVYASPSIKYFDPERHMPFALLAIAIELLVSWPICLLLLFAPCLSKKIDLVRLRLKPIVDELQACYRPECRWFAGFYFLARQLMYLVCLIPQKDLPQSNALRKQYICMFLILVHTIFQPYRKKWLNVLDTFFLIDILIFSMYVAVAPGTVQHVGLNVVLYNATPYLLILLPSCYLFGAVVALPLKKLYTRMTTTRSKESQAADPGSYPHNNLTDSFFNDDGEREPLLATIKTNDDRSSSPSTRHPSTHTVTHTIFSLKPSY